MFSNCCRGFKFFLLATIVGGVIKVRHGVMDTIVYVSSQLRFVSFYKGSIHLTCKFCSAVQGHRSGRRFLGSYKLVDSLLAHNLPCPS